jgi:segregation and condensation protein A
MFEVRHDYYAGPMEKLLELIEQRQLEISRVNLSLVTADFIAHVEQLGEAVDAQILSDFIVVAARLLVIKSKELVPNLALTEDEEEQIIDLEHRLRLYREFKNAGELLKQQWNKNTQLFGRDFLSGAKDVSVFYPSAQISQDALKVSIESLLRIVEGLAPAQKTVASAGLVTLQQKMTELTDRLMRQTSISFKGRVTKDQKQEVIVLFLAVLHLLANRLADVEQADQFGDITVSASDAMRQNSTGGIIT